MATCSRKSCALRDFLGFEWPDDDSDANDFQNQPCPPIAKQQRFQQLSTADIQELSAVKQPKNTEYSMKWALKNVNEWKTERNLSFLDNPVNFETLAIRLLSYASISSCDVYCIVCRLLWNFGTNWSRQKHVCLFLYETRPPWGTVWDYCPPWPGVLYENLALITGHSMEYTLACIQCYYYDDSLEITAMLLVALEGSFTHPYTMLQTLV